MFKKYILFAIIFICILSIKIMAQGISAVPFLLTHPSPNLNGMAGAFTALPTDDPFGQYYNPAQLGNFSRSKNLSIEFYPVKTHWLPEYTFSDLAYHSTAFSFGYNFENIFPILPVSLGFGLVDTDIVENRKDLEKCGFKESYKAYSLGFGIDYFVKFNLGYTYKKIDSDLGYIETSTDTIKYKAKANAEDFGVQLTIPCLEIYSLFSKELFSFHGVYTPFFNFSLGYALTNVGKEIYYTDKPQSDPLPKTAKIGYAVSLGANRQYNDFNIMIFKFDWSTEANDLLINCHEDGSKEYQKTPGNIKLWDHVLLAKSDDNITIHQGWRINLFEFFQYSHGRFKGPGYLEFQKTDGFLFSSSGLLKWASINWNNNILKTIVDHVQIDYMKTRYTSQGSLNGTEFEGLSISIFGF